MTKEFMYTSKFNHKWTKLGFDDDDLISLELYLLENPTSGKIMEGTGGLRKLRWALPNRGKSGGVRILYVDYVFYEKICVLDLFAKNDKENLSKTERVAIKNVIKAIGEELRK